MKREEQAKKDCTIVISDNMEYGTPFAAGFNKGIEAGVKWADAHPNWHKYPKEKPIDPIDKEYPYDKYIVFDEFGVHEALWDGKGFCLSEFSDYSKNVISWMELPEPPKYEVNRFLLYAVDSKGNLLKAITTAMHGRRLAEKYYSDCENVALVSIDENGAIIEILKSKYEKEYKDKKQQYINNK